MALQLPGGGETLLAGCVLAWILFGAPALATLAALAAPRRRSLGPPRP